MKPFDTDELKTRVQNLLEQRKRLYDHFRKSGLIEIDNKDIKTPDKTFLRKVRDIIEKHISDTSFNVDIFADEIGMSRSQLHRKLVSFVGESPGELISRIRIEKAAKLIENTIGNISEIALEVGFNNPAYFATRFRKHFHISPSEYSNTFKNKVN